MIMDTSYLEYSLYLTLVLHLSDYRLIRQVDGKTTRLILKRGLSGYNFRLLATLLSQESSLKMCMETT